MKRITNIGYKILEIDGSIKNCGCVQKFFSGAFRRIKYLKKLHGPLIKFDRDEDKSL